MNVVDRTMKTCPVCLDEFATGGVGNPRRSQVYCSAECAGRRLNQQVAEMTDVDAAWLAGVFDGEGHVCLYKRISVQLRITQCDRRLLDRVVEVTGVGTIKIQREATERHRASYVWTVGSDNAAELLFRMLPWLIVKREAAIEALVRRGSDQLQFT